MLIFTKMKKDIERTINLPSDLSASLNKNLLTIKGNGKDISRKLSANNVNITIESSNKIIIKAKSATKRESKMIGTICAHINNMIKGLVEGFEYKMEICNVHFPMNVKVDGDSIVIKSFLGEKTQRVARILPNVDVSVKSNQITIKSLFIENAGQTAANIEKATRVTNRDRRIFQDGIFITEKNGRKI